MGRTAQRRQANSANRRLWLNSVLSGTTSGGANPKPVEPLLTCSACGRQAFTLCEGECLPCHDGKVCCVTTADTISRRAVGMLLRQQAAMMDVENELQALLANEDDIKDLLASGDWRHAAIVLTRTAISAYHAALAKGQS